MLKHGIDDTSLKSYIHVEQITTKNDPPFKMFDYGLKNMEEYGTEDPPDYDLSLVNVPIALLSAKYDEQVPTQVRLNDNVFLSN